jgi:hypothetical protein
VRLSRLAGPVALALSALILSGCELLLGGMFGGGAFPGDPDGGFPTPSLQATFTSGTATIVITRAGVSGSETVTLDRLAPGATLTSMVGANASWRNDDGWALAVMAFEPGQFGGPGAIGGDLSMQRVSGTNSWTTADFTAAPRCIVEIAELSVSGLTGSASCRGLRWIDALSGPGGFSGSDTPVYVEGQDPFDAEVTFAAH